MLKNAIYTILIIVFITSCKSKSDKPLITPEVSPDTIQKLITKLKPILQGVWVKKDYIDKVISTRSPLLASDKVIGITTMHINSPETRGDSLPVLVTYDNKNPGGVILRFKQGKSKAGMPFGENELGYSIKNADTTLVLYQYYQNRWVLTPYIRALRQSAGNDLQDGINYLINKNLFAGRYSSTDIQGKKSDITFKDNGEISGFGAFTKYTVESSYDNKVMNNLDEITFNQFSSDEKTFIFKIDANTLNLFEVKPNANSTLLITGKLKYKLVKVDSI